MESNKKKGTRLAKNTLVLYVRMLLLMAVNLYTSRVILQALGVNDFGIYNVVGGFVAMFSIITRALAGSSSRFFNVAMGKGNMEKLNDIFCAAVNMQLILSIIVIVLCEPFGIWYIANKMVLPPDRVVAAQWLLQFSVFTFCFNLVTIPYHSAIIAHERMKAFAYVSLFEGMGKLVISFLVMISPIDRLVFYGLALFLLQFAIRNMYQHYCRKNFKECKYHIGFDRKVIKEMLGFSIWTFIGHTANILRIQGNSLVLNLFFGPAVNAAQAVSTQVNNAINGFVTNFMTAMKPQITQSYASGAHDYMFKLLYRGSRFSYYLLLFLSVPIIVNIDFVLGIWLKKVPEHTALFAILTIFFTMVESISNPLIAANNATGKIRNYQLIVGSILLLNVPLSYTWIKFGGIPEVVKIVGLILGVIVLFVRVILLHGQIGLDTWKFTKKVIFNVAIVSIISYSVPLFFNHFVETNFLTLIISVAICLTWTSLTIFYVGCSEEERLFVKDKGLTVLRKKVMKR